MHPDLILINLPSNDANVLRSVADQTANYRVIIAEAAKQSVPLWVTTPQPRNFTGDPQAQPKKNLQWAMKEQTPLLFPSHTIDFWTGLASADGNIVAAYNCGDDIHLNDAGHRILFERVAATMIQGSEAPKTQKTVHYYAPTFAKANLHYKQDSDAYTTAPGIPMMKDSGEWFSLTINDLDRLTFVFNDGTTWDNNGSANYTTLLPALWVKNGIITATAP